MATTVNVKAKDKNSLNNHSLVRDNLSNYDETSVLEVLDKVSRSVVNVSTIKILHHMFYRAVPVKGMGSGTIIDSEGQILTNNHVVTGAEKIGVTLTDGRVLEGRVIGTCSTHDMAIIKVKEQKLPAAEAIQL
jgi:serine protease Do